MRDFLTLFVPMGVIVFLLASVNSIRVDDASAILALGIAASPIFTSPSETESPILG